MSTQTLGNRMKGYEAINRTFLIPNMNNIIRIDGKAFHTYTEQFKRPFDEKFVEAMNETAIYLCSKIQGAKFGFVQSDEISIMLTDYDSFETDAWYKGNIQKIVSVSASMAAAKFNQIRMSQECSDDDGDHRFKLISKEDIDNFTLAEFDSRVFQLPNQEEAINCFLWRQQDCTKNSIASVAQNEFSYNELLNVNTNQMQEMLFTQKNINWNDIDPKLKRGRFIDKITYVNGKNIREIPLQEIAENDVVRTKWEAIECPIFSKEREFIKSRLPNSL